MYIHSELFKVIKSKKSVIFILIMFLIPCIDLVSNLINIYKDYWLNKEIYGGTLPLSMILHPAMGSFLAGSSEGHISQMLLVWVMPIYLMIIYSDFYIREVDIRYNNIVFCKMERKKIVRVKMSVSFLIPFFISLLSLVFNFILSNIFFAGGENIKGMIVTTGFLGNSLRHPNITYMVYILIYSIISGGCGLMCSGISYLFPNIKVAYPVVFFIWIVQIICPYSLTYAIQPFIEYGPEYFVPAIAINMFIVIVITAISYIYKVKCDEI